MFTIQRRVANETMNSDTIGIPRFGPGGYYLTNVLFTQYFTADGASIHYNYWSSNWGYAASHGCLGLTYADSAFLWDWAGARHARLHPLLATPPSRENSRYARGHLPRGWEVVPSASRVPPAGCVPPASCVPPTAAKRSRISFHGPYGGVSVRS